MKEERQDQDGTDLPRLPFGSWPSPLDAASLATGALRLGEPWILPDVDAVLWLERRPAEQGRQVLVRGDAWSSPADVTPEGFDVSTSVHEYGGGAYAVDGDVVVFSNRQDQRLYRQSIAEGQGATPVTITRETEGRHHYADGQITADGRTWIGVRERHEGSGTPAEVVNEMVALPVTSPDGEPGEPTILVGGRDFYATPRVSPDGKHLAFLTWDLPFMPWDGTELFVADLITDEDGAVAAGTPRLVAGRAAEESIFQPTWSPAGELHFASDRTGWWNLYRDRDGSIEPVHEREAEFGWPLWVFGLATFAFLDDGRIACIYSEDSFQHVAMLDPETGELLDLDLPFTAIPTPAMRAAGDRIAFIAAAPDLPESVVSLDFTSRSVDVLREASPANERIDTPWISDARAIEFPTEEGRTAYGFVYPPRNPEAQGLPGQRPPLIVMSHGGPTSATTAAFDPEIQFWTTRGFAVVDVNYGGSVGYGRAYRKRLDGMWGLVDTADCLNAARYLAAEGEIDGDRLLIRGGSAGGFTTLCALTFHDDFAAGTSYYGVSDLEALFTGGTHKFESRYEEGLVGPWPEAADLHRARSPIHSVGLVATPILLLQGADDVVVPPDQAEVMVEALEAAGLPYAYLLFDGEGHGFRKAETIRRCYEAELSFYAQVLGFEPAGDIERLDVMNLPNGP
jgi:dipeptidyl aminopeptidase/acylaminoacyl peptidase